MQRIPALDSIRGLFLVMMTLNHLIWISGGQSFLMSVSQQPLGQFGAAAGFILLSGFLAGAVYGKKALPCNELVGKAWGRAFSIYRHHLFCLGVIFAWLALSYLALPLVFNVLVNNMPNLIDAPLSSVLLSALLINKPNYLDILPLYVMFMLLLPFCVYAYQKGAMWLVLLISGAVWAGSGYIHEGQLQAVLALLPFELKYQVGYFDPFAWQFLFIAGSACGYLAHKPDLRWYNPVVAIVVAIVTAVLFVMHHGAFLAWGIHPGVLYALGDKPELGWLRLLNVGVWAYLVAVVIHLRPTWLDIKPLSYIGRHSLQVFTWHIVLIYLAAPLLFTNRFASYYNLLVLVCLASIWIPAWVREQPDKTQRIKRWAGGCGFAMVAMVVLTLAIKPGQKEEVVADAQGLAPLSVEVKNLRGSAPVLVMVYAENDDLMGMPSAHVQSYSVEEATDGITINGLEVGKYAIFAYQDADNNHQFTMGPGGMPQEAFGYSNNPAIQGMPSMAQIQFSHPEKAHQVIQFIYL
uniref:OpgC domain-containing protein n=1 Tax=Thaumasiovibrio occultus TaxID=1891184 RepID=UPI000B34C6F2|nr:OpgC domain-containing protein [Thaumasiovibrio occultus]